MQNPSRAIRRHHKSRMKAKARKVYPRDSQAHLADHLAACSCPTCGNPRRHFGGETVQERRAATVEELDEFDEYEDLWEWKYGERHEGTPFWSEGATWEWDEDGGIVWLVDDE